MRCILAGYTDMGRRKNVNQDSMLLRVVELLNGKKAIFVAVCDGMGGFEQGDFASREMVRMLSDWLDKEFTGICDLKEQETFEDALFESWENLFQSAHQVIRAYGEVHRIRIGTTATAILFMKDRYYTAHVGDSRAYAIGDQISRLTQDQNVANVSGTAESYRMQNGVKKDSASILLQGIGASKYVCPVYDSGNLHGNVTYLLCSDGFVKKTSEEEMLRYFFPLSIVSKKELEKRAEKFIKVLRERGERDDVTVLLVRTIDSEKDEMV